MLPNREGYFVVGGPTDDFVRNEIDQGLLLDGQPYGLRVYADAFLAWKPKEGGESRTANITLRQGVTVKGRVVGPDDQPVADAWIVSRFHTGLRRPLFQRWLPNYHGTTRNGQFQIHGLDPATEIPVSFLEPSESWARPSAYRASERPASQSSSSLSHAARPPRGWSGRTASRSMISRRRRLS